MPSGSRESTSSANLHGVWANGELYACAEGSILRSQDGGDAWNLEVVSVNIQLDVWAAGQKDVYTVNSGGVITYADGASLLKVIATVPSPPVDLLDVHGDGDLTVAVGEGGTILVRD